MGLTGSLGITWMKKMVGQKDNCFVVNQVTRISGQTRETKKDQKQGQKNGAGESIIDYIWVRF